MLLEYETFFKHVIKAYKHNTSFENFVLNTCKKGEYAKTLNILAISLLLNKTIYFFVESIKDSTNVKHIYSMRSNDCPKILIGCYKEHFFPLLNNENDKAVFIQCIDLDDYNFDKKTLIK